MMIVSSLHLLLCHLPPLSPDSPESIRPTQETTLSCHLQPSVTSWENLFLESLKIFIIPEVLMTAQGINYCRGCLSNFRITILCPGYENRLEKINGEMKPLVWPTQAYHQTDVSGPLSLGSYRGGHLLTVFQRYCDTLWSTLLTHRQTLS